MPLLSPTPSPKVTLAPMPTVTPPIPPQQNLGSNLIINPWFQIDGEPSFEGWIDATGPLGSWTLSEKEGNPSPNDATGTAARVSTGRGKDDIGASVPIGYDAYLYQIVQADSSKLLLEYDAFWVMHTVDPAEVNIYGGNSPNGPWIKVWTPFYQSNLALCNHQQEKVIMFGYGIITQTRQIL